MKALYINSRPDAHRNPGGDNTQLTCTRAAVETLGVEVTLAEPGDLERLSGYDLAHVFNIQTPESAWRVFQALQSGGIPIVLSPIYWDMYEYWAENALRDLSRWRLLGRVLSRQLAARVYLCWQKLKAPRNEEWKIQRRLLSQAGRVLPNSASEGALLSNTFNLSRGFKDKIDIIPNGVELEQYRALPDPDPEFLQKYGVRDFVLQVGSINPVKNQLGLIQALFSLPIPIVFVGKVADAYTGYGDACKALGAARGAVYFVDHVPHARLPGIYALAAVHALPSWRETPGLASLEAAAAGRPIVTTNIGSTRDYFGGEAWFCHPGDPQSVRRAVEAALSAAPSAGLRSRVLSEFTWEKAGQKTLQAYQRLLASQN